MEKQEVIDLMASSDNSIEWGENCDIVKAAHGGQYPDYWYAEIILSGLCDKTLGAGSSTLRITTF